jgi:hypothetical protein
MQMGNIQVINAVFGYSADSKDVTPRAQQLVDTGNASFFASIQNFGDPAVNHVKSFGITYKVGSAVYTYACQESEEVNLRSSSTPPTQFVVQKAVFGAMDSSYDVTALVQQLVSKGPSFVASIANFGDPAPSHLKHFTMTYAIGNNVKSFACNENETVTLSAS